MRLRDSTVPLLPALLLAGAFAGCIAAPRPGAPAQAGSSGRSAPPGDGIGRAARDAGLDAEAQGWVGEDGGAEGLAALRLLTAGAEALADGHAEEALLLLDTVPPGTAAEGDRHFLRGVALLQLDRLDESAEALRASVALQPVDVSTRCVLARVLRGLGDLEGAAAELQAAVSVDEQDAHLRTLHGHLLLELRELGAAFDELVRAVELDPGEVDAHRGLALVFAASGDPEHAALAWRQALALAPDEAALHAGLAAALRSQGLYAEALPAYATAAELQPGNAIHLANVGSTLALLGRFAEAREAFAQALIVGLPAGEQRALVHANFGDLLERLGDIDGAADEYRAALADDPGLSSAREALGLLLLDGGDPTGALEQLRGALEAGGISAEGVLLLALLHERLGQPERAQECAELLAADESGSPEVAFRHAQLLVLSQDERIRDLPAATAILRELLEGVGEGNGAVWNLLGEALAMQGAYAGAVEAASRAVELAGPDHPASARYRSLREQYLASLTGP